MKSSNDLGDPTASPSGIEPGLITPRKRMAMAGIGSPDEPMGGAGGAKITGEHVSTIPVVHNTPMKRKAG